MSAKKRPIAAAHDATAPAPDGKKPAPSTDSEEACAARLRQLEEEAALARSKLEAMQRTSVEGFRRRADSAGAGVSGSADRAARLGGGGVVSAARFLAAGVAVRGLGSWGALGDAARRVSHLGKTDWVVARRAAADMVCETKKPMSRKRRERDARSVWVDPRFYTLGGGSNAGRRGPAGLLVARTRWSPFCPTTYT